MLRETINLSLFQFFFFFTLIYPKIPNKLIVILEELEKGFEVIYIYIYL